MQGPMGARRNLSRLREFQPLAPGLPPCSAANRRPRRTILCRKAFLICIYPPLTRICPIACDRFASRESRPEKWCKAVPGARGLAPPVLRRAPLPVERLPHQPERPPHPAGPLRQGPAPAAGLRAPPVDEVALARPRVVLVAAHRPREPHQRATTPSGKYAPSRSLGVPSAALPTQASSERSRQPLRGAPGSGACPPTTASSGPSGSALGAALMSIAPSARTPAEARASSRTAPIAVVPSSRTVCCGDCDSRERPRPSGRRPGCRLHQIPGRVRQGQPYAALNPLKTEIPATRAGVCSMATGRCDTNASSQPFCCTEPL